MEPFIILKIVVFKKVVMNGKLINQKELKDFDNNNIKKYLFFLFIKNIFIEKSNITFQNLFI